nr:hypothetical protein WMHIBSEC_WMHIBSEC_CDS_0058 [Caudoviricetes sp.]CAI9751800.1 hypothetical protein AZFZUZMX_AZFZUZMX_CDS_0058 [Caudoviricetes sp.]
MAYFVTWREATDYELYEGKNEMVVYIHECESLNEMSGDTYNVYFEDFKKFSRLDKAIEFAVKELKADPKSIHLNVKGKMYSYLYRNIDIFCQGSSITLTCDSNENAQKVFELLYRQLKK